MIKDGWPLSEWNNYRAVMGDPKINDTFPTDPNPWQPGKISYIEDGLLFDIVNQKLSEKDPLTTNWESSALTSFTATGVELVEVPAATTNAGKEDDIIKESEIDLKGNIYRQKLVDIARGAAKGTKDSYAADLNKRWSKAQAQVMK